MACGYGLCSTSFPGGHQVDGLPPASSRQGPEHMYGSAAFGSIILLICLSDLHRTSPVLNTIGVSWFMQRGVAIALLVDELRLSTVFVQLTSQYLAVSSSNTIARVSRGA